MEVLDEPFGFGPIPVAAFMNEDAIAGGFQLERFRRVIEDRSIADLEVIMDAGGPDDSGAGGTWM